MRTRETQIPGVTGSIRVLIPCPLLPDGIRVSKYRSPVASSETPAVRRGPIYFLFFSVSPCLRGAKVLSFGCGPVALCALFTFGGRRADIAFQGAFAGA